MRKNPHRRLILINSTNLYNNNGKLDLDLHSCDRKENPMVFVSISECTRNNKESGEYVECVWAGNHDTECQYSRPVAQSNFSVPLKKPEDIQPNTCIAEER